MKNKKVILELKLLLPSHGYKYQKIKCKDRQTAKKIYSVYKKNGYGALWIVSYQIYSR